MNTVATVNALGGYTHNPRGNIWLNDESTFGQKLLMKMGWSKGKGLGKNEDGIKENLKLKYNSGQSGVGWKNESSLKVLNIEYDSLLTSISKKSVPSNYKDESGSLELRSQAFRNRLHYRKFVRGKDITRYSEKDLKSIFMSNVPTAEKNEAVADKSCVPSELENSHPRDKQCSIIGTYTSKMNISDYFSQKLQAKSNFSKTFPNLLISEKSLKKRSEFSKKQEVIKTGEESIHELNQDFGLKRLNNSESYISASKKFKTSELQNVVVDEKNLSSAVNVSLPITINKPKKNKLTKSKIFCDRVSYTADMKELADGCSLFHIPNSKSVNYNCWIESQRQALKMKLYKNMLKNIKSHEILKTSNLLSLRGYGNWGF